jgi:hypothetical protein
MYFLQLYFTRQKSLWADLKRQTYAAYQEVYDVRHQMSPNLELFRS